MDMEVYEALREYNRQGKLFNYSDYASWDDGNRYELIDGVVHMMSAPTADHQRVLGRLFRKFADYLDDKTCEVFVAPFDVCLSGKGVDDHTVVQPDILVICDESKIDNRFYNGAPDLVVEILSPSTSQTDRIKKQNKYLQAGVREYWIVDPVDRNIVVNLLENGRYIIHAYDETDAISVHVFDDCIIALTDIFK